MRLSFQESCLSALSRSRDIQDITISGEAAAEKDLTARSSIRDFED
jgi:hypothetical protein